MQPFSLYDFSQTGLKTDPNSFAFSALQENFTTKPTLPECVEVLQNSANSAADFISWFFSWFYYKNRFLVPAANVGEGSKYWHDNRRRPPKFSLYILKV